MSVDLGCVIDEIVEGRVKLASVGNIDLIKLFINEVVLRVLLNIGLEVVTVLLLFFSEITKEISVVLGPSVVLRF